MIGQPRFDIHAHRRKLVRRAILIEGDLQDALMDIAMGAKLEWSTEEITALNDELENCSLSIEDWLKRMGVDCE